MSGVEREAGGGDILIRLRGVSLGYGRRSVLESVELEVPRGSFLGVIGPNGSGKTTLLKAMLGLLRPMVGAIEYPSGRPRMGYVEQRQFVDDIFPVTVREVVLMGRAGMAGPLRPYRREDREAAEQALTRVGMGHLSGSVYRNLSGGQKQRCLLARALASRPEILVLDEPTNDMDIAGEEQILQIIEGIRRETGVTVMMVSHLLHVVLNYARQLALLREGGLVVGPVEEIVTGPRLTAFFGVPVSVGRVGGRRAVVAVQDGDVSRTEAPHG